MTLLLALMLLVPAAPGRCEAAPADSVPPSAAFTVPGGAQLWVLFAPVISGPRDPDRPRLEALCHDRAVNRHCWATWGRGGEAQSWRVEGDWFVTLMLDPIRGTFTYQDVVQGKHPDGVEVYRKGVPFNPYELAKAAGRPGDAPGTVLADLGGADGAALPDGVRSYLWSLAKGVRPQPPSASAPR